MELGEPGRLRTARESLGLNSRELAGRLGVSKSWLNEIETGQSPITSASVYLRLRLAKELSIDTNEIISSQELTDYVINVIETAHRIAPVTETLLNYAMVYKNNDGLRAAYEGLMLQRGEIPSDIKSHRKEVIMKLNAEVENFIQVVSG